jgi:hypothetical protein
MLAFYPIYLALLPSGEARRPCSPALLSRSPRFNSVPAPDIMVGRWATALH